MSYKISVVFSTRKIDENFIEHVKKTCMYKDVEVLPYENNGEYSLTEIYNKGLNDASSDIVVFCHDDIFFETKKWGEKVLKIFEKNPEYGIVGVAGSKYMPESGQWWANPKKMYGRVAHTHEGKTWLSSYSKDLGQTLEEVVVCDGVWFALDKTKIKKEFNENVKGFHFYDVTFAFENYLKGVKIGITTEIRINHQSIGITNESWEKNRATFAKKFKDNLPVTIKRVLRENEKLKIMLGSVSLNQNFIREQMMMEIGVKLKKLGHNVTIVSTLGGPLMVKANKNNIKTVSIQEPPGFKMGDGKWVLKTQNGPVTSVDKTLYKISDTNFDIIHVFNDELIDYFIKMYGDNILVNNNFIDGLIINTDKNELVSKTIDMKTDLNLITNEFIDDLLKHYNKVL